MQAAEMFVPVEHPTKGRLWQLRGMVEIDGDAGAIKGPAPLLGQHTDEVLTEIGFTREEIEALHSSHAVA
jgi:crotonobetainyl-CoA:carnitine CoA-transferase CaiB-like acyl-CoA transferase